ncbi:acyl-coenzyme A thioesterase 13 [Anoplophora glabripennis]|uniref:Acyl-coenzyme A thioesterase 13 n=1 Tax=Anoplophora glabripennis TaxID=217634 RepID=V5GFU8_ANOGL|nr:acyl-coenzyme A thioesterase 13 [Anoplophora glabripennis]XP_023311416.1 acyl-coenzyme A thioesterase 13 [Anoplophora glabripennis]
MSLTAAHIMKSIKNAKSFEKVLDKIKVISLQDGNCLAEMEVSEEHTNPLGGLHGGFSATLVDNISSYGLLSHKFGSVPSVSVDLHTTYLRGAKIGDTIEIDARTLRVGKSLAVLEVYIKNKVTGELLVKGSHTKFLMQSTN